MARKIIHQLIDDIDGAEIASGAGETVSFSLNGSAYEIDLSDAHIAELNAALAPFIAASRKVSSGRGRVASAGKARSGSQHDLTAIREWASNNGYTVADRGRIPQVVVDAYYAAN